MGATETGAVDGAVKNMQSKSSGLSGSVGISGTNAPDDVWKVSSALTNNGLMEAPQRHADNSLFTGITKAQENMDSSLKRDGLVNPGGPTENTYTRYVGQGFMKAPDATGSKQLDTGTGLKPLGTAKDVLERDHAKQQAADQQARLQRQADRRQESARQDAAKRVTAAQLAPGLNSRPSPAPTVKPETVKKAVEGLSTLANKAVSALTGANSPIRHPREGGDPGASTSRMDSRLHGNDEVDTDRRIPTLSDDAYAENRRTADALGKVRGVGDLPRFTSDAINTNGEKAVHEVADLIGQVHERSPDQAKELFDKTAQGIAPENRAFLQQAVEGHLAEQKTSMPPKDASMDEHGNWFDKDGNPIGHPVMSPDVHQARVAAPLPGAVPPPPGTIGQTTPDGIQKMMDRYGREFQDWWNEKTSGSPRTDQAPQLPNQETFPADEGDPSDGVQKGRPTEPDRVINPPPYEMPKTGEYDGANMPPSQDQSNDPDLVGPQVQEYNRFERPVEFAKGDKVPTKTQEALDALDPATAQLVKEVGLSDGTALSGNEKGIHIETGKPVSEMDADFRAIVRKFGDDPDGPKVDTKPDGSRVYPAPDGVKIMQRSDKQAGMTIEIQVPSAVEGRKLHMIKRRYK